MKRYTIRRIESQTEIENCERAEIAEEQWRCRIHPKAWAYMGYLEGEGLFVRLACEEKNPHRVHVYHKGPVWKDSALELFLAFPVLGDGREGGMTNECLYLNFEVNANAAMYAQYGFGRHNREFVPDQVYRASRCRSVIGRDGWRVEFLIPSWYLEELTGKKMGDWLTEDVGENRMHCNFYKVSESPEIEHYMSYAKVESEAPNFHLPMYFAETEFEN